MDLALIMEGIGTQLATINGLRVYDFPTGTLAIPAAVVAFPESITYDATMGRGSDRMTIPVHILVGKTSDRGSAALLNAFMSGAGTKSVKTAIELDPTLGGNAQTTRVTEATVSFMSVADIEYLAATFDVDVLA